MTTLEDLQVIVDKLIPPGEKLKALLAAIKPQGEKPKLGYEDWRKKFVPETAQETIARTDDTLERLRVTRLKWEGLDDVTLALFGLRRKGSVVFADESRMYTAGGSTCLQCQGQARRREECSTCALRGCITPHDHWKETGDTAPMLELIDKAIAAEEAKQTYTPCKWLERRDPERKVAIGTLSFHAPFTAHGGPRRILSMPTFIKEQQRGTVWYVDERSVVFTASPDELVTKIYDGEDHRVKK